MKIFYQTTSQDGQPTEAKKTLWKQLANKENWRISQLENGYFQTEFETEDTYFHPMTRRTTIEAAETAIDETVKHYLNKLKFIDGPKVVKTFKK
jgi:hypothetical protein